MKKRSIIYVVCTMVLAGCSHQDFSGGVHNPMSPLRAIPPGSVEDAEQLAATKTERLMAALVSWQSQTGAPEEEYVVGPDDVVELGIMSLRQPGEMAKVDLVVGEDGNIHPPYAGDVHVAGLTIAQVQTKVAEAYSGEILKNPQVVASMAQHQNVEVLVAGAVERPGVHYLKTNKGTLLEVLAVAGGFNADASDDVLIIRGGTPNEEAAKAVEEDDEMAGAGATMQVDLEALAASGKMISVDMGELLDGGDFRMNVEIHDGDIVNVRPRTKEYVYVLGYVMRPGSFAIPEGEDDIDPVRAVALAGGLSPSARAQKSFVVRQTLEGQQIIALNLVKAAKGKGPAFDLVAGDTMVVGSDFIARLAEFVRPSANVGMNAAYSPIQ